MTNRTTMTDPITFEDALEAAMDHEQSALVNLARATLAVDQLAAVPGFRPVVLGDALDTLKTEFVRAHAARRAAEEVEGSA